MLRIPFAGFRYRTESIKISSPMNIFLGQLRTLSKCICRANYVSRAPVSFDVSHQTREALALQRKFPLFSSHTISSILSVFKLAKNCSSFKLYAHAILHAFPDHRRSSTLEFYVFVLIVTFICLSSSFRIAQALIHRRESCEHATRNALTDLACLVAYYNRTDSHRSSLPRLYLW